MLNELGTAFTKIKIYLTHETQYQILNPWFTKHTAAVSADTKFNKQPSQLIDVLTFIYNFDINEKERSSILIAKQHKCTSARNNDNNAA